MTINIFTIWKTTIQTGWTLAIGKYTCGLYSFYVRQKSNPYFHVVSDGKRHCCWRLTRALVVVVVVVFTPARMIALSGQSFVLVFFSPKFQISMYAICLCAMPYIMKLSKAKRFEVIRFGFRLSDNKLSVFSMMEKLSSMTSALDSPPSTPLPSPSMNSRVLQLCASDRNDRSSLQQQQQQQQHKKLARKQTLEEVWGRLLLLCRG